MLARRSPLRTRTPLRRGKPPCRWKSIRRRRPTPRRSSYPRGPGYLTFLRVRPCRAPGLPTHAGGDSHRLRHDARGNSLGAHLKDDSRAISLCRPHHQDLHARTGPFAGWSRDRLQAWENEQVAVQRAEYEAQEAIES